jgi:hypothetical protein
MRDSSTRSVLYLVISGAPAPEGVPALIRQCQDAGWQVAVFSTPMGARFIDPDEVERLTGQPVRSEYRMPGTGQPVWRPCEAWGSRSFSTPARRTSDASRRGTTLWRRSL